MFEKYNEKARRALFFARYEASVLGSNKIDIDHLLLGILRERSEIDNLIDDQSADALRSALIARIGQGAPIPPSNEIPFSRDAKAALERAAAEADLLGHAHIGTEHLLLAALVVRPMDLSGITVTQSLDADSVRKRIRDRPART